MSSVFGVGESSIEVKDCSIRINQPIKVGDCFIRVGDCSIRVGDCSIRVYQSISGRKSCNLASINHPIIPEYSPILFTTYKCQNYAGIIL